MSDNDPTAGGAWNDGCDFAMTQLCLFLGVNQNDVRWDAATETVDGDVQAVIGNILRAKFGEDWGPDDTFAPAQPTPAATVEPVLSGLQEDLILMSFHNEPEPAPHQHLSAGNVDALAVAIKAKLSEPAFVEFAKNIPQLNEAGLLPIIKIRPTGVTDWVVVLPSGREIMIGDDEWKAAEIPTEPQQVSVTGLAERIADVVMMLDAPDAYNRAYIAAVCRSILSQLSRPQSRSGE